MISFVRGTLSRIEENTVEIDTGSIGYEIMMPLSAIEKLPAMHEEVRIFTHFHVREDEMSLFGFLSREDLALFKQIITISGIGPKGALGILSVLSAADLRFAILAGDAKSISKAPGIGAKTAQRLIMELKDKVSLEDGLNDLVPEVDIAAESGDMSARSEAVMALTALGYSSQEALKALKQVDTKDRSTEDILRDALKYMGGF